MATFYVYCRACRQRVPMVADAVPVTCPGCARRLEWLMKRPKGQAARVPLVPNANDRRLLLRRLGIAWDD